MADVRFKDTAAVAVIAQSHSGVPPSARRCAGHEAQAEQRERRRLGHRRDLLPESGRAERFKGARVEHARVRVDARRCRDLMIEEQILRQGRVYIG
jgi:hypothetical protein